MAVITSVARVLRCFEKHQELSVTRLTEELELPKSTVSRLMLDMAKAGFLEQDPATRRYRPGPLLLTAARYHQASLDLVELAYERLVGLVDAFGHTGFVVGLEQANVVVLRTRLGTRAIRVHTADHLIGGAAYNRSAGRALLARLADDRVRTLFPTVPPSNGRNAPRSIDDVLARLRAVRATMVSEALDESIAGVGGISVAFGPSEDEAVALNITFAAELVRASERRKIAVEMVAVGREVAARVNDPIWRAIEHLEPRRRRL